MFSIANASKPSQSAARRAQRRRRPDWARIIAAPVITKRCGSRRPMMPGQFNFMRRFYMRLPPTHQGALPDSCALLIEPTVTRMARSSGPAAPPRHPTAMRKAFIAALKQVKTGKFDADGDEL
jgi:hypothetical protein